MEIRDVHCCACKTPMRVLVDPQAGEEFISLMVRLATCQSCLSSEQRRKELFLKGQEGKFTDAA